MDGIKLKFEDTASFLGLTIDCHLTWEEHCNKVANKISRNSSMINRVKHLLPSTSLKILYCSFIQPHLQYGAAVWGGYNGQNRRRIVAIQKRIIRTITKSYFTAHTVPRLKKIGLLHFDDIYNLQCSTLIHDILNENSPKSIKGHVTLATQITNHQTRNVQQNPLDLRTPVLRSRIGNNSFSVKGPKMWNEIPHEIRSLERKDSFKRQMKTHLLSKYHLKTECRNPRCNDKSYHV